MDTRRVPHITSGLPWEGGAHGLSAQERQRVAQAFAELRRAGADPHYAWLAALDASAQASGDPEDWGARQVAVS